MSVGIFGSLASPTPFLYQLIGTAAIGVFTFSFAFACRYLLKVTVGIRVSEEAEGVGLDVAENSPVVISYNHFLKSKGLK